MASSGREMFLHLILAIFLFGMIAAEEEVIDPIATSGIETTDNMDTGYTELPEGIESTDGMDYDDTDEAGDIDTSDIIDSIDDIDVADSNVPTDYGDLAEGIDATDDTDSNADFDFTSDIDSIENPESTEEIESADIDSTGDIDSVENTESSDEIDSYDIDSHGDLDLFEDPESPDEIDSSDIDSTGDIDSFEHPESADEIDTTGDIDSVENIETTDEADIDSTGDMEPVDSSDTTDNSDIVEQVDSTSDIDSTDKGDLRADIEIDTDTEDHDEELTRNGFSKKRMQKFCSHVAKGSKPIDTHTCRYVTCDRNGYKTGAHVFNANICPIGQFCDDGTCTSMVPELPKEALTNEEWKIVNAECKKQLGRKFGPYCSDTNIATHPDIASGCKNDLCDAMLCAGIRHRRVRFTWAYLSVGSKCGVKKTCNKHKQCERDDWVESR